MKSVVSFVVGFSLATVLILFVDSGRLMKSSSNSPENQSVVSQPTAPAEPLAKDAAATNSINEQQDNADVIAPAEEIEETIEVADPLNPHQKPTVKSGKLSGVKITHVVKMLADYYGKDFETVSYYYENGSFLRDYPGTQILYDAGSAEGYFYSKESDLIYKISDTIESAVRKVSVLKEAECKIGKTVSACSLLRETDGGVLVLPGKSEIEVKVEHDVTVIPLPFMRDKKLWVGEAFYEPSKKIFGPNSIETKGILVDGKIIFNGSEVGHYKATDIARFTDLAAPSKFVESLKVHRKCQMDKYSCAPVEQASQASGGLSK